MWFQPLVLVPRSCPLCGYEFWRRDGHLVVDIATATNSFQGHDSRWHRGHLTFLARTHD